MATKDRTSLKNDFANGKYATGEKFADLIDSMKVVQLPVVDPQALGASLSFIDSITQDADGKITATKKTLDLANAHELNPFKGWYKTGDTLPTDGFDGAYLYFKDTSELTGQTTIYRWNGTAYTDTGTVVDTSNVQTLGSGQAVNEVKIKDENGVEVQGTADVLSAEAGSVLLEKIGDTVAECNHVFGKAWDALSAEISASSGFAVAMDTVPMVSGASYRWYSEPPQGGSLYLRVLDGDNEKTGAYMFSNVQTDSFGSYRSFTATINGNFQMAFFGNPLKAKLCKLVDGQWETIWNPKGNGVLDTEVKKNTSNIGVLTNLTMRSKTSLVNAVNEVAKTAGLAYWSRGTLPANSSNNVIIYRGAFSQFAGKKVYAFCVGTNITSFDASFRDNSHAYISNFTLKNNDVSVLNVPANCYEVNISVGMADSSVATELIVYISEELSVFGILYEMLKVVEDRLDEGRNERIHSTVVGYFTTSGAVKTSKRIDWADAGWVYCPEYIPVNSGDSIKINFGKYDSSKQCIIGYDSSKTKNRYWGASTTSGTRTISSPSDMSYIRICFFKEWVGSSLPDGISEGDPNTTPLVINGVPYVIDDITMLNSHDALSYPVIDNFGLIGKYYPKEVDDIKSLLNAAPTTNYHRFHFLHISDTHGLGGGKIFGYANDLLTYADAKFLVHTGDIVENFFSDGISQSTITAINSCTKPFYWVLGNHDYGSVGAGGHAAVFTQYMTPMNTHNEVDGVNGETVDKTYYSIDYSTEKVKCIFLDMNDGWSDTDIADRNVNQTTAGRMSETQIRWFINELLNAATNNLHVCCFIHTTPYEQDYDLSEKEWCDVRNSAGLDVTSQQAFLAEIVDAFIGKTSTTFTYNGVSYTADFSAKAGHFICWFCGHTHYDNAGFMKGHEKQFIVNVPFPQRYGNYSGGYLGDGVGVQFNYVTIDTNTKSLAVYRVGCQNTIFATTRKSFRVLYV